MADDETEEFFIQLAKNFQKPSSDKPVLQATFEQSEHLLRALLQQAGKDPNELNEDHISPVWCACYVGSTKCLEILLEHNANPDIPDRVQQPPLFVAVYQGSEDNVKLLLQSNASLYSRDSLQRTALHAAADAGNASIIKLLIEHDNSLRTQSNTDSPPAPLVSWEDHQGRTALHYAAANNQCECVDSLINGGANVDQADHKHYTPLHVASEIGHDYVVDILIDETANMEALDSLGRTPLHIACTEGKSYCVDLLIANGAEISTFDGNGLTALHLAVLNDQVEIVKLLLDGAEVETVDEDGNDTIFRNAASPNLLDQQQRSAMHAAAELGNVVLCELLLQRGTELNSSDKLGRYPIHYCGLWSPAACVDWFLVKGVPVDETDSLGRTCLHYACYFGNYQVAHALLRRGANANLADNNGDTPLLCSLHEFDNNDKTEIGQLLLEFGANPLQLNLKKRSPIHICSCTGDTETLELLLDSSDSDNHRDRYSEVVNLQDVYGVSCMHLAAANAQCDNLEFLIQRGGNPNAKDSTGATILMWAVRGGSVDCVDMMLHQFHAAVDTVDHAGRSLLHVASIANSFECVRPLLEVNCSPMLEDAHGRNALHYGAHYGSLDVLKLFNPNTCTGLDWNKTDKVGQNPLHRSVSRNHLDLSKFLIDRGTNVNQADQNGVTPLMLAAFHNSSACVDLLLANSADPSLVDARGRTYKAYIETGKKFRDGQYSTPGTKPIPIPSQPAPEPPAKEPEPVIPEPIKVEVPVVAEPEKEPPVTPEPVKVEVPEHKPENPPEELVEKPPVVPVVPVEVKPEVKLEPVKEPEPVKVPEVVNNPPEEIEKPKEIPENVKKPEKQPEVVKPPVVNNSNNPESVRSLDLVGEEAQAPVVKEIRTPKQKPERLAVKRVNEPVSKPNQPFVEIPVSAVPQPVEPRDPQILPHENPNPDYQAVATAPAQQPFYMYPYLWLSAILSFLLRVLFRSN